MFQNNALKIQNFVQLFWVKVRRGFFRKEKNNSNFLKHLKHYHFLFFKIIYRSHFSVFKGYHQCICVQDGLCFVGLWVYTAES